MRTSGAGVGAPSGRQIFLRIQRVPESAGELDQLAEEPDDAGEEQDAVRDRLYPAVHGGAGLQHGDAGVVGMMPDADLDMAAADDGANPK